MKDDTIEVISTAHYTLRPVEYRLAVWLGTPQNQVFREDAGAVPHAAYGKAMEAIASTVIAKGFPEGDMVRDGTGSFGKWWGPRELVYGRENSLVFRAGDAAAIMAIPVWLDDLDLGPLSACFEALPVRYEDAETHEVAAFARALSNARTIAAAMAASEGRMLGTLIRARDLALVGGLDEPWQDDITGQKGTGGITDLGAVEFGEDGERRSVSLRALYRLGGRAE